MPLAIPLLTGPGALTTSLWSERVLCNTSILGDRQANDRLGTFAWFLPFACYYVGFKRLRRTPRADWQISVWQFAFMTPAIGSWIVARVNSFANVLNPSDSTAVSIDDTLHGLNNEWMISLLFAGCYIIATLGALGAVVHLRATFRRIEAESGVGN